MKTISIIILIVLIALTSCTDNPQKVIQKAKKSVVIIKTSTGLGSGVLISPDSADVSDNHLRYFTGANGLAYLISFFERNLADPKELAEIIRRLHIPRYEEALKYLERALKEGIIDSNIYTQDDLKRVIEEYGD